MGRFVNPDNSAFQVALNSRIGTFPDCGRKSGKKCIEDLLFSACSSIISCEGG